MEDIVDYLSNKVYESYIRLSYSVNRKGIKQICNIVYCGKYGNDFVFNGLIPLVKICNNKDITCDILGENLISNLGLEADDWIVFLENNSIIFNCTKNKVNKILENFCKFDKDLITKTEKKEKILVDFSSPNIAKDMHVGHLRSTIIGDSICRLFEKQGHEVHRINHIGDFGLQFGMLIEYMIEKKSESVNNLNINDLQEFYVASKKRFDTNENFKKNAYQRVVDLQRGDKKIVDLWNEIKDISRSAYNQIYEMLNINLKEVGESFYQDKIPDMISELRNKNLLIDDSGRVIIKVPNIKVPLTVIKSDGCYTYDTTDLAAIKYRLLDLGMDQIYYVVDDGQSTHLKQIFYVAKMAGWLTYQKVNHINFGLVCGNDGKRFRTRNGETSKLIDLLYESLNRTSEIMNTKNTNLTEQEKSNVIKNVAFGSIKYADLSSRRTKNYVFSYDKMLSLKGNTAPYLLYAYVRICSILRNVQDHLTQNFEIDINLELDEEINLLKHLVLFPNVVKRVSEDLMFNKICDYLYDLCVKFHIFFSKCRCVEIHDSKICKINYTRIYLCQYTQNIMSECFYVLGINTIDKM